MVKKKKKGGNSESSSCQHHSSAGMVLPRGAVLIIPKQSAEEDEWRDWSVHRAQLFPSHVISPSLMAQIKEADLLSATHPKCRDKSVSWVEPPQLNQCHNYSCHSEIAWFLQIKGLLGITCFSHCRNKGKRGFCSFRSFGISSGGCCCCFRDKRVSAGPPQKKVFGFIFWHELYLQLFQVKILM